MAIRFASKQTVFNCPTWRHLKDEQEPEAVQMRSTAERSIIVVFKVMQIGICVYGALMFLVVIKACLNTHD
jgi:hypothetical protein